MMNSREKHIRQQIDAYVKGQLSEAEIEELWETFAKQPELLDILELEVNLKAVIEKEAQKRRRGNSPLRRVPAWAWYAAAAATVLIVASLQFFNTETPTMLSDLVVDEISAAQLETADGIRAVKEVRISTADSLLNIGFKAALSGREDRALNIFEEVIANYNEEPYASKAFLNKGIILYNEGRYETAITAFEEAAERGEHSRPISEKAYWYMGNALVNTSKLEEAREAVFKAYQLDGVFRKPAFRLIQKLNDDLGTADFEELSPQNLD